MNSDLRVVGLCDMIPEKTCWSCAGVRTAAGVEVEVLVRGDWGAVVEVVGLDVGSGEDDECVRVVEQVVADGGVVDPLGRGHTEQFVRFQAGQRGRITDTRHHEQLRAEE